MLCDQVIILNDGWVVASGAPDSLRTNVMHRYTVECRNHPSLTALLPRLLNMLSDAEMRDYREQGDFVRFVLHTTGHDPRLEVYRFFGDAGIDLRELSRHRATLEDVFVHYTTRGRQESVAAPEETGHEEVVAP